jgi:exopolyphosphatase / guanosine-5'-triphosphate,3'-diphosphate pyrophosphatase
VELTGVLDYASVPYVRHVVFGLFDDVRRHVRHVVSPLRERLEWLLRPDRAVGTSKTFKQLARLSGAPSWRRGTLISRYLRREDLQQWIPRLAEQNAKQRATLPGVSAARARQLLGGAIAAESTMEVLGVEQVDVCPWAIREGILLRRLEQLADPVEEHQATVIDLARVSADQDGQQTGPRPPAAA